jgi:hypothetical protein
VERRHYLIDLGAYDKTGYNWPKAKKGATVKSAAPLYSRAGGKGNRLSVEALTHPNNRNFNFLHQIV